MLAVLGTVPQVKATIDEQFSPVVVYVQYGFGIGSALVPKSAEGLAAKMFAKAGVRTVWRAGLPSDHPGIQPILIEVTSGTPKTFHPGALAYALVYERVHIRVFWDRIDEVGGSSLANNLLAHVMVHEIAHILEGVDHHSLEGLMKARWSVDDILQMQRKPLPFDPYDLRLIHTGLARRTSARQNQMLSKDAQQDEPVAIFRSNIVR
jgi:hypothetical protein